MPWQQLVEDVAGEVLPSGRMAYPVVVCIVPRRAGKSLGTLARSLQRCSAIRGGRSWYTAQSGGDAGTTFRDDWVPLVNGSSLSGGVALRLSNGSEGLSLPRYGSRLGLFAPTEKALHGKDADHVVVDEGWAFTDQKGLILEAAFRPAMATRRKRQLWIISAGGTDASTWLLRYRTLGRALGVRADQGLAYFEWHPPVDDEGNLDADLDDPAVWAATHPAVGYTLELEALVDDRRTMPRDVFDRSYLNVFQSAAGERLFPASLWDAGKDAEVVLEPAPRMPLAFDVSLDRDRGAVVACRELEAGRAVVELLDYVPERQLAARVAELHARYRPRLLANGAGPVTSVTRELRQTYGLLVEELDAGEFVDASGELLRDVKDGLLIHRGQQPLDAAAAGAGRRELLDGWALTRKGSTGDVSPLVAAAVARFGARRPAPARPAIYMQTA